MLTPPLNLEQFESMIRLRSFRLATAWAGERSGNKSLPSRKQTQQWTACKKIVVEDSEK
jgi:hypothetical protein